MLEIDGDFAQARQLRERLLALEHDPMPRAKALSLLSRVLIELGEPESARKAATEAIATLERANPKHPSLQVPLTTLGRLTPGPAGDALLERALALPRTVDHEYQGDVIRAMAERAAPAARRALLERARHDYAEAQVDFRVRELEQLLR